MEFMLSGQGGQLRLPVPPTDFTLQSGNINQIVNVVRQGEINLWGPERLDGITIQSFFPAKYAPYCKYEGFPLPWNCVKTIDDWRNSGKPVRLIIVDSELGVDINMLALIESFDKTMPQSLKPASSSMRRAIFASHDKSPESMRMPLKRSPRSRISRPTVMAFSIPCSTS